MLPTKKNVHFQYSTDALENQVITNYCLIRVDNALRSPKPATNYFEMIISMKFSFRNQNRIGSFRSWPRLPYLNWKTKNLTLYDPEELLSLLNLENFRTFSNVNFSIHSYYRVFRKLCVKTILLNRSNLTRMFFFGSIEKHWNF